MMPVLLSGGSGTRLWPLSSAEVPKQLSPLGPESLLSQSFRRLQEWGSSRIVTTESLVRASCEDLKKNGLEGAQFIVEPAARNTAAAIALVCRSLQLRGEDDSIVGIFPADHLILKEAAFRAAVEAACAEAERGFVVTLGIQPTWAATGFGYIELADRTAHSLNQALEVRRFREKPSRETAEQFLEAGRYVWNAGIFVFRCDRLIEAFTSLAPEIWRPFETLKHDLSNLAEIYDCLPKISFGHAIMEKLTAQRCVPCDIGWHDLGSWDDIAALSQSGQFRLQNVKQQVVEVKSHGSFVVSSMKRPVALVGVDDLIVIDTPEGLLVTKRGQSQDVKSIADQLSR